MFNVILAVLLLINMIMAAPNPEPKPEASPEAQWGLGFNPQTWNLPGWSGGWDADPDPGNGNGEKCQPGKPGCQGVPWG